MSAPAVDTLPIASKRGDAWLPLPLDVVALVLALILFYGMTVFRLLQNDSGGLWSQGEHSHGPIMLTLSMWLYVTRWREHTREHSLNSRGQGLAWPVLLIALILFVAGRSLGIIYFEVGSYIPMMAAVALLMGGRDLLMTLKFPIFFAIFMVPLPGFILDPISHFVKLKISMAVTELLWPLGYPISHTGVVITVGPYQLLVADACAGMRTLFMMEAMGIFYLNVIRHSSVIRNVGLAMLIVPISFVANMTRVLFLTLITYHFGDEAGQGFLHGFAGIVLFATAMFLMMGIDTLLRRFSFHWEKRQKGKAT
ncbi:MAG: exosortase B [Burkholderiales bacterium]|nr:exosortase B [Burkholderiales bacterium]MDE2433732.1 exosortase B [Burkholderiales bacterium]